MINSYYFPYIDTLKNVNRNTLLYNLNSNISLSLPENVDYYNSFNANINMMGDSVYDIKIIGLSENPSNISPDNIEYLRNTYAMLYSNVSKLNVNMSYDNINANIYDTMGDINDITMTKSYYLHMHVQDKNDNFIITTNKEIYLPDIVSPNIISNNLYYNNGNISFQANIFDHSNVTWQFAILSSNVENNLESFFDKYVKKNEEINTFTIESNVSTYFANIYSNVNETLVSGSTYYAYLKLIDEAKNKTLFSKEIYISAPTEVVLTEYDSKTVFDGLSSYLFYPQTNGTSTSFTNNSQILSHGSSGGWGSHTYVTTTDTPDGSNSMILQSQSYGYAGLNYPNGNSSTYTVGIWVKFDHDSDNEIMTLTQSNGWGGSIFTVGNSNEDGRQINIQFEATTGYLRVFVNGLQNAINTVSYQSVKYNANTWLLVVLSIENTNIKVYINGRQHLNFEIENVLRDAYNQKNNTTFDTLSQTAWSSYVDNYTNIIMLLRDIQPTYYSFQLWKIYALDRALSDSEHMGFYMYPII